LNPRSRMNYFHFYHCNLAHWVTGKDAGPCVDCGAGDPLLRACWGTAAGSILLMCVMNRRRSFKAGFKLQIIFSTYKMKTHVKVLGPKNFNFLPLKNWLTCLLYMSLWKQLQFLFLIWERTWVLPSIHILCVSMRGIYTYMYLHVYVLSHT
jgi:hypothetical protein